DVGPLELGKIGPDRSTARNARDVWIVLERIDRVLDALCKEAANPCRIATRPAALRRANHAQVPGSSAVERHVVALAWVHLQVVDGGHSQLQLGAKPGIVGRGVHLPGPKADGLETETTDID